MAEVKLLEELEARDMEREKWANEAYETRKGNSGYNSEWSRYLEDNLCNMDWN